jgi:hypothetical protein
MSETQKTRAALSVAQRNDQAAFTVKLFLRERPRMAEPRPNGGLDYVVIPAADLKSDLTSTTQISYRECQIMNAVTKSDARQAYGNQSILSICQMG